MQFLIKKKIVLCPCEEMYSHFKLHNESFSYFVRWFYMLILTFLTSKQNNILKTAPKMLKHEAGTGILRHILSLHKQTELYNQI